jgi:hypothetical protein
VERETSAARQHSCLVALESFQLFYERLTKLGYSFIVDYFFGVAITP